MLCLVGPGQVAVTGAVTTGTVSGRVTDGNGNGVGGLRVRVLAIEAVVATASNGGFTIDGVPTARSSYRVELLAPCGRNQDRRVVVDGSEVVNFTVAPVATVAGYQCRPTSQPYSSVPGATPPFLSEVDDTAKTVGSIVFPFFGVTVTSVSVGSNGLVTVEEVNAATSRFNTTIPQPDAPNAVIAPFWDDLDLRGGGTVNVSIDERNDQFSALLIEWRNAAVFGFPNQRFNFQVELHRSGRIVFLYDGLGIGPDRLQTRGAGATVGIEDFEGDAGLQASFNEPLLESGYGIEFIPSK